MRNRNYIKEKEPNEVLEKLLNVADICWTFGLLHKRSVTCILTVFAIVFVLVFQVGRRIDISMANSLSSIQLADMPLAVSATPKSTISIPTGIVKANPFVPYREVKQNTVVEDVPSFNLVEPPEMVNENSDAARVMDTIVSGILYDKFSPSAILNIEGSDYLVKKGDVVNNYKVVNITQDSVTVQLGANVYKAGIGEILTEGQLNFNQVSNLNKKFGGIK